MNHGKRSWLIPDMFWPASSADGSCVSHEAICLLNLSDEDCRIEITLYYEDMEPVALRPYVCPSKRTLHIRMDKALDAGGSHIPRGVGYAAAVDYSVPAVVQYTRVDATQAANSLMTTMAYPLD